MLFSFTYSSTTGIYTLSLHDALPISAYDLHGFTVDDIIDFTPELRAEGLKIASRYKLGPIFTPPVVSKWEGPLATLALRSEEHTSELQSPDQLVCRLLLEKKNNDERR